MTMTSDNAFPLLSQRGLAACAAAMDRAPALQRRERNLIFWLWIFGAAALLAFLVEIGIGMTLNTAIITNQRDELTGADQAIRGLAALAMAGTLAASVFLIHLALDPDGAPLRRLLSAAVGLLLFASVIVLAASIGYGHFGGLLSTLWSGQRSVGGLTIDAAAPGASTADPPFMIRLMSSALLVGVAILFSLSELAWLLTRRRLDATREELDCARAIVSMHSEYEAASRDIEQARASLAMVNDGDHQYARGVAAVHQRIQKHEQGIEQGRPGPIDPAQISKAEFDRRLKDGEKVDRLLQDSRALAGDANRVMALVDRVFPRLATSKPMPGATSTGGQ